MTKLVISSTGEAAEKWGEYLGQYECAGEHHGAPYYKQTDDGSIGYLYRDAHTAWRAGPELGSTGYFVLYHPPTGDTPPLSGWQWYDYFGDKKFHDAPSLVMTPGPLSPPRTITLQAEGELATLLPHHLGTFTVTDRWCWGRPVFRNQPGKLLYYGGLDGLRWSVGDTFQYFDLGDIWCEVSAGLWPPQAGPCLYKEGGAWREDVVTVTTNFSVIKLRLLL